MFKEEKREFKVGDILLVSSWASICKYKVTRVTKTQAICEVKRSDGTSFSSKYRKEYTVVSNDDGKFETDENGRLMIFVHPIPYEQWNTKDYYLIPNE